MKGSSDIAAIAGTPVSFLAGSSSIESVQFGMCLNNWLVHVHEWHELVQEKKKLYQSWKEGLVWNYVMLA